MKLFINAFAKILSGVFDETDMIKANGKSLYSKAIEMKSFKEIQKDYTPEEIAEALVFSDNRTYDEKEEMLSELRKLRKEISDTQTEKSKMISQLLQLKFTKPPDTDEKSYISAT